MMKNFISIAIVTITFLTTSSLQAQNIDASDIDRFIKTFVPLTKDLNALGKRLEKEVDGNNIPLNAKKEAEKTIKKYGWDNNYAKKVGLISSLIGLIAYEKEMKKADKATKEMMLPALNAQINHYKSNYGQAAIDLVRSHFDTLRVVAEKATQGQ
ncbi:MAG: hypothetical protein OIF50_07555 [Flavobacteriaceae bacterium]|nr:hypothetical protein [Flavobacteriaceae bacterium]